MTLRDTTIRWATLGCVWVSIAACSNNAPTWTEIHAMIERDYPETPAITTEQLATRIERGDRLLLVDVRTEAEYAISHLPSAVHLPAGDDYRSRLDATVADWKTFDAVVLYCSVGYRSAGAAARLEADTHAEVLNLTGSIFTWANEGRPLVNDSGPTDLVHDFDDAWGTLLKSERRTR